MQEKEIIESTYGLLWSGEDKVIINGKEMDVKDILRALDISLEDAVPIDVIKIDEDRYVIRFYDGDDRRIVAMELNGSLSVKKEYRFHIAEWLGEDVYTKLGGDVFFCHDLISGFKNYYTEIYLKGATKKGE